jgi:hypothetical protein
LRARAYAQVWSVVSLHELRKLREEQPFKLAVVVKKCVDRMNQTVVSNKPSV